MHLPSVYLAVIGIKAAVQDGSIDASDYQNADQTFRNIVLSLIATYGIYIVASILALDPWHMVTSFVQYLLVSRFYPCSSVLSVLTNGHQLAPSYINVFK